MEAGGRGHYEASLDGFLATMYRKYNPSSVSMLSLWCECLRAVYSRADCAELCFQWSETNIAQVLFICGTAPTSRRYRITATSPSHTAPPAQLLWPTGFLCGWSVGLEFPAGQLAESDYWREQFQTISEDVFVAMYWCIQHIRGFTTMRYINQLFTYLLTYLRIKWMADCFKNVTQLQLEYA